MSRAVHTVSAGLSLFAGELALSHAHTPSDLAVGILMLIVGGICAFVALNG